VLVSILSSVFVLVFRIVYSGRCSVQAAGGLVARVQVVVIGCSANPFVPQAGSLGPPI
jgi:hypothetical protein